MLLMSRCLHYPYGAEQHGPNRTIFATMCCQQNPTRDTCVCAGLTLSICIVGESSRLSILHLVDACACLLSKQPCIYLHHPVPFFFFFSRLWQDYWKQKLMRVVAMRLCESEGRRSKLPGPLSEDPRGSHIRALQGPNYRQLTKLETGDRGSLTGSGGHTHAHVHIHTQTHTSTLCFVADQQKIKGNS